MGFNIVVSKYPKFVNVDVTKKDYFVVLERWWLGSEDNLLAEGLTELQALKIADEYMKSH